MRNNLDKQRDKIANEWGKFCREGITFEEYVEKRKNIELKYPYEDTYVPRTYKGIRQEGKREDEV